MPGRRGNADADFTDRLRGGDLVIARNAGSAIVEHVKIPLDPMPIESVTAVFQALSIDESAVSVGT